MAIQVIVVNGGSSSGKSGLVRCLQAILPDPWLSVGVDMFVDALPASLSSSGEGITFGAAGEVILGGDFVRLEEAWRSGVAAMARAGALVIIDDAFLSGGESQARLRRNLDGLKVLWVGVRCDGRIAAGRETARGDRTVGMAALQAESVHAGVSYDIEVDTGDMESFQCAAAIATHLAVPAPSAGVQTEGVDASM